MECMGREGGERKIRGKVKGEEHVDLQSFQTVVWSVEMNDNHTGIGIEDAKTRLTSESESGGVRNPT